MALVAAAAIMTMGASALAMVVLLAANSDSPAPPSSSRRNTGNSRVRAAKGAGGGKGTPDVSEATCGQKTLDVHNDIRRKHPGRKPLVWDDRLAAAAQRKAETCVFEHLGDSLDGKPLGENLAWGTMPGYRCDQAIRGMYETEPHPKGTDALLPGGGYNHATQILYPKATKVGCGRAKCPQYGTFIACMYDIPNGF